MVEHTRGEQMVKAFGYARVSDVSQIRGDGFERQVQAIRAYALANGYEIVTVYREDVSGTKDEAARPVFQEMISAILANGVQTIIVEALDRLAREMRIQETLLIYLASKGVDLISARTGENVTQAIKEDPLKKAMIQIQGVFSELEKNQIVRRLRVARERIKATGRKCEGRPGYRDTEAGRAIVHKIRLLRRNPKVGRRLTWKQIADRLNKEGIKTLDGNEWSLYRVQQIAVKK
jgi:site-specific DNA recombinase